MQKINQKLQCEISVLLVEQETDIANERLNCILNCLGYQNDW